MEEAFDKSQTYQGQWIKGHIEIPPYLTQLVSNLRMLAWETN
jgi:hypothetical protein